MGRSHAGAASIAVAVRHGRVDAHPGSSYADPIAITGPGGQVILAIGSSYRHAVGVGSRIGSPRVPFVAGSRYQHRPLIPGIIHRILDGGGGVVVYHVYVDHLSSIIGCPDDTLG